MCRENASFRADVRAAIQTSAGRRIFDKMFGAPVRVVEDDVSAEEER
jgi:hypothetical protein